MKPTAKRFFHLGLVAVFASLLGPAIRLHAGDPVPDVDVILEQVPGGVLQVVVRPPVSFDGDPIPDVDVILEQMLAFDGMRLTVDKRALRQWTPGENPAGWGLAAEGKRLLLRGPAVPLPARLQLEVGDARPERLGVELLRGGQVIFSRMKISPRIVPPRRVAGTLTGTVRLPPQLSPGETMALRSLADAKLPPGGTWVISGTVSEPWEEADLLLARAINTTRSHLKKVSGSSLPLVLEGEGGCETLAPIAAVLEARGHRFAGETPLRATAATDGETPAGGEAYVADLSPLQRVRHDTAMSTIRNLKFFFTVSDQPPSGIAINEEEDPSTGRAAAPAARRRQAGKQEAWQVSAAAASDTVSWTWTAPGAPADARPGAPKTVALDAAPIAGGCRFTPREVGDLDVARWARMQQAPKAGTRPPGKPPAQEIHIVTLPDELRPGDGLSVRYLDEWGDPWVEVAEAADVEIVAPSEIAESSFIESASPYAVAGDQLCVCGAFSAVDVATDFFLGSEPAAVVSLSSRIAWLQTSAGGVGPTLVRAQGLRGEAATELLRVRAELDQEHLFTGQSTPLRIVIEGSASPLPIRIHTGTPQVIEIEGGPDQNTETSGGAVNQVLRQVRGLERGAFELGWELRPSRCPCAEPG